MSGRKIKGKASRFALGLLAAGFVIVSGCDDKKEAVLTAPTDLNVTSVTAGSVTLNWSGNADSYQININDTSPTTDANYYVATALSPLTTYTWRVRAVAESQVSEWVTGPSFTTGETVVTVNFGEGLEVWTAQYADWYDYQTAGGLIDLLFTNGDISDLPAVQGTALASRVTVFPQDLDEGFYFEYFSEDYWERSLSAEDEDGNTIYYGDWWVSSGSVTITQIENLHVSGRAELVMFDHYSFAELDEKNPEEKSLMISFSNVPQYAATRYGALRSAMWSTERSFSFVSPARNTQ